MEQGTRDEVTAMDKMKVQPMVLGEDKSMEMAALAIPTLLCSRGQPHDDLLYHGPPLQLCMPVMCSQYGDEYAKSDGAKTMVR